MTSKKFTFNGTEYGVTDNVLKLHNIASPFLNMIDKATVKYTSGVDMTAVNSYRDRLTAIENKDNADKEYLKQLKEEKNEKDVARVERIIEKNKVEKEAIIKEYEEDVNAQNNIKLYQRSEKLAIQEVITNDKIIIPFLEGYLIGDTKKLDMNSPDIVEFIGDVCSHFFLSTTQKDNG